MANTGIFVLGTEHNFSGKNTPSPINCLTHFGSFILKQTLRSKIGAQCDPLQVLLFQPSYQAHYTCLPPPLAVLLLSLVQVEQEVRQPQDP